MPRKSKNSTKRNLNQFELQLLDDEDDDTNDNVACSIIVANSTSTADVTRTSARGRPLKPTLQFDPEPRPSRKKSAVPKAKSTNADPSANEDSLARIEALLKRVGERAERAEKCVESLEEFIRNELFPRVASPPESAKCASSATAPATFATTLSGPRATARHWVGRESGPRQRHKGRQCRHHSSARERCP
ncbi:hypothetical protein HIM_10656 [Hirsutella minnesotensis 3608]|uniref:Uncharacterized protein n=1 Tax=Hirsutella minnesotensis 3608 TaxID=1043627 RepID=A0A0F7ZRP0_9HYPO|nr:hypothetical protein HIM_10656 [Hirsutella minnesotensis 3608]